MTISISPTLWVVILGLGSITVNLEVRSAGTSGTATRESAGARERLAWFEQAKYGLFIHWGLASIPGGEWNGQHVPGYAEHIMKTVRIPCADYSRLAGQFNPQGFNADVWVGLARDAGMKYIVFTAKHHDGFAMFHSQVSRFNIHDATPFGRDPVKELAEACARAGMPFGVYYSHAQDWYEPGGASNNWEYPANEEKDRSGAFDRYLEDKSLPQVRELLQNFGPIALIWFDTPHLMNAERGRKFLELVHSLQPRTLVNSRLVRGGAGSDYLSTGDNKIPSHGEEFTFEVPATVNQSWGFRRDDTNWKSPGDIIFKLVDVVSKGGNLLLNVGPTAEGVIPQPSQDVLRSTGQWLQVNGEAIYGAGRTPFGEELGDYAANTKDRNGKPLFLARGDWRCTTKPGRLYFTVFRADREGSNTVLMLPDFPNGIRTAYLLEDPKRQPLSLKASPAGHRLVILPPFVGLTMGTVVVVEIAGEVVQQVSPAGLQPLQP